MVLPETWQSQQTLSSRLAAPDYTVFSAGKAKILPRGSAVLQMSPMTTPATAGELDPASESKQESMGNTLKRGLCPYGGGLTSISTLGILSYTSFASCYPPEMPVQIQQDVDLDLSEQLMERKDPLTQNHVTGEGAVMSGRASGRSEWE